TTVVVIYVYARLSMAGLLILDQRMSTPDALGASWKITNGKVLSLIGLALVLGLIGLLGVMACCIGFLFAVPYIFLCHGAAYMCLTGQLTRGGLPPSRRDMDDYGRRDLPPPH